MYADAYAEAIRPEQIEQAVSVAVATKFNQPHMPIEDCVQAAVEQVFCPCVSNPEGEGEMPRNSLRGGIIDSIVGSLRQGVCADRPDCDAPREGRDVAEVSERKRHQEEALDDALALTFPASDPVALLISPLTSLGTRRPPTTQPLLRGGVGGWKKRK